MNWDDEPELVSLRDAVTGLAFDGHPEPSSEAIRRLCEGEWDAHGAWEWWAWAEGAFSAERRGWIPAARWQGLRSGQARGLAPWDDGKPLPTLSNGYTFARADLPKQERVVWDWQNNRFETALLTGVEREEWFSAWDISVRTDRPSPAPVVTFPAAEGGTKGGRPPVVDWELAALEMAGRFYRGDLKPQSIADVVRALQDWAAERGRELPDTTAQPHARQYFKAFKAWEAE